MPASFHSYRKDRKPNDGGCCATEKGFTLLEVLAAVTVYALLLGSVFSLYLFGVNTYKVGSNRLDLQQNVRVAADFISRELRYAHALQQVNDHEVQYSYPGEAAPYTIKHKNGEVVQLISNTETKIAYNIETLIFNWDEHNKVLYFSIKGNDEGNTYAVRSAVCLQNLRERW